MLAYFELDKRIYFLLGFPNRILIHEFIHTIRLLLSLFLIHILRGEKISWDRGLSQKIFSLSCGGNIFPKAIGFLLWHCWRCTICKGKSENSHSSVERSGWWSDEPGAPLSKIWGREKSEADSSAEGLIESSTESQRSWVTPNETPYVFWCSKHWSDPDRKAQKYQVRHVRWATRQLSKGLGCSWYMGLIWDNGLKMVVGVSLWRTAWKLPSNYYCTFIETCLIRTGSSVGLLTSFLITPAHSRLWFSGTVSKPFHHHLKTKRIYNYK